MQPVQCQLSVVNHKHSINIINIINITTTTRRSAAELNPHGRPQSDPDHAQLRRRDPQQH